MSIELLTLIMFGGLIVLLILGLPLGFALGGIGVLVIYLTYGFTGLYTTVTNVFGMIWNIIFIALPFLNTEWDTLYISILSIEITHVPCYTQ